MSIETTCTEYNNNYNIIKLNRNGVTEFYLEKVTCGNLYFLCGADAEALPTAYIKQAIRTAETSKFWK